MQELCSFQNAIFTLLQGEFSSCHKQLFFSLYSQTFSNVRANQTQHDRSLGEKRNTAQRAEKKSGLIMNIHVVGGLSDCCLKELWAVANSLSGKRQIKKVSFFFPHNFQMSMSENHNSQGSVCPQVTPKIPTSTLFFRFFFVSKFGQESFSTKWCSAEWQQTQLSLHWLEHTSAF